MADNFPNNVFISEEIQKQIDTLKDYTQCFKEKHLEIFENDVDDTFIQFIWKPFPQKENGKDKITFDVKFSDKLPIGIQKEFFDYLKQFMSKTYQWVGHSSKIYETSIHPLEHIASINNLPFNPKDEGYFIFAKRVACDWKAVYIGEGNLRTQTIEILENTDVLKKGATHIHALIDERKEKRESAIADLLLVHSEAYIPMGYNVRK